MKSKIALIVSLLLVIVLLSYNAGSVTAQSKITTPAKIGVVSWRTVLNTCDSSTEMDKQFSEKRKLAEDEITKLQDEVVSLEIDVKTSKPGSDDYMEKMQQLFQKKAIVEAKQQFHKQEIAIREQKAAEDVFRQVIEASQEVGKEMGLDLVLAKSDNEFPLANPSDLMLTVRTTKVYYNSDAIDITPEVIERMNAKN